MDLPAEGFTGRVPAWPLSRATARERDVWKEAWRTPQATQWVGQKWRHRSVGLWVRWTVRAENPDSPAADAVQAQRLADQIGLSPAGLKENGWQIVADEVGAARESKRATAAKSEAKPRPARRLRAVAGGGN
ncbi:hypothetical protein [Rhodococcus sp. B10]|uniref:hypothetical protein n=1 Tax=Rhodococcus sp. B10 TaxID=2695876 RepID=UPI003211DEF3